MCAGDTWIRNLANTSGAIAAPLLQRMKTTPSKGSLQRKSGGLASSITRSLTPSRRHSISSFMGWDRDSTKESLG